MNDSIIFIIFPVIIGYRTYLFMQKSNIRNTKNLTIIDEGFIDLVFQNVFYDGNKYIIEM